MSTYISPLYHPLQQQSSFRLLTIHPGTKNDILTTTLTEANLEDPNVQYEALSYTWGADLQDQEITCNETTIFLTPNCFHALKQLRHPSIPRDIWIDSICIDQFSIYERNHQVGLMGKIYERAYRVIAWLGQGDAVSRRAFVFLHEAMRCINATAQNEYLASDSDNVEGIWGVVGAACDPGRGSTRGYNRINFGLTPEALSPQWNRNIVERRKRDVRCIKKLLQRSWFQRMWTVQELAVSQVCLVCCGDDSIVWDNLITVLRALDLIPEHCFLLLPVLGHLFGQQVVQHTWTAADEAELPLILQLLISCRSKGSTDPRDKFYSLYGLMGGNYKLWDISVDYSKSVEMVYMDIARKILSKSRSPTLLLFAASFSAATTSNSHLDLPSWVPDWSSREFDTYLKDHPYDRYLVPQSAWQIFDIDNPSFRASKDSRVNTIELSLDTRQLTLYGNNPIDEIVSVQHCSFPEQMLNPRPDSSHFPQTSPDALAYINCRWDLVIPLFQRCLDVTDGVMQGGQSLRLMTRDLSNHHLAAPLSPGEILRLFHSWVSHIKEGSVGRPHNGINHMLDAHSLTPLYTADKWKSTFDTLLTQDIETGLSILNDPAAKEFHELLILLIEDHQVYFTRQGRIGLSCSRVEVGDAIALLEGLGVPVVLRPTTFEEERKYRFVGSTYLAGVMNGEVWDDDRRDKIVIV